MNSNPFPLYILIKTFKIFRVDALTVKKKNQKTNHRVLCSTKPLHFFLGFQ